MVWTSDSALKKRFVSIKLFFDQTIYTLIKELSIDMYFRQIWTDQRLQFSDYGINVAGGQSLVDKIWTPDTFFSSVSTIRPVKYPAPNVFVKISPTGDILFTQR